MRNIIGYCLILSCAILGLGLKFSAATPLPINTTTCEATKVTANSATLNGRISNYTGELVSVTLWFKYGTDRDNYSSISTSTIQSVSGGSTAIMVSIEISGLSPTNTTYYYRIVGQSNEYGESTGRERSFTTLSETPTVTGTPTPHSTSDCSNCTIQGRVINAITKKGIKNIWISGTGSYIAITDEDGNYSWYDDDEYRLPELCCGGAYTLTAEADGYESLTQLIDIDPCISNTLDFELQPISASITPSPLATPTPCDDGIILETYKATDVTSDSAILNGLIGGEFSIRGVLGFEYGTSSGSYTNNIGIEGSDSSPAFVEAGSKSVRVNGLSAGTTHYYRIYKYRIEIIPDFTPCYSYGNEEVFTTLTGAVCEAESVGVSPKRLIQRRKHSGVVTVTLKGDNCIPEGKMVTATINKIRTRMVRLSLQLLLRIKQEMQGLHLKLTVLRKQ